MKTKMEVINWKNVGNLCAVQLKETKKIFKKIFLWAILILFVSVFIVRGGNFSMVCDTMARWIVVLAILLMPVYSMTSFIGNRTYSKLSFPGTSLEKILSYWVSTILTTLTTIAIVGFGAGLALMIIGNVVYSISILDFLQQPYMLVEWKSILLAVFLMTGEILWVVSNHVNRARKRWARGGIFLFALLLIVLHLLVPSFMVTFGYLVYGGMAILFLLWGYFNFSKINITTNADK